MTDLHSLLDLASRPITADERDRAHDVTVELRLGRRAVHRRRLVTAGGTVAASTVAAAGVVTATTLFHGTGGDSAITPGGHTSATPPAAEPAAPTPAPAASPLVLTDTVIESGPFRFGRTPQGWTAGEGEVYAGSLVSSASAPEGAITVRVHPWRGQDSQTFVVGKGWVIERHLAVDSVDKLLRVDVPASIGMPQDEIDRFMTAITIRPEAVAQVR